MNKQGDLFTDHPKVQKPKFMYIGCADSRVTPERIFNVTDSSGEIFVVRNVGNQVNDTSTLAAVQYAVDHLHIPEIVICGHTGCGAVRACLCDNWLPRELGTWLMPIRVDFENKKYDTERGYIECNVTNQVKHLQGLYPSIKIGGYIYDLKTGLLDPIKTVE